jgi:hypothetical protein
MTKAYMALQNAALFIGILTGHESRQLNLEEIGLNCFEEDEKKNLESKRSLSVSHGVC